MLGLHAIRRKLSHRNKKGFFRLSSDDLLTAVGESEKGYLAFGSELRRIYERTAEISQVSTSLAGLSEEKRLGNLTTSLKDFFEKKEESETESWQGSLIIGDILARALEVETRLKTFRSVIRTLRVLCNSIKIESVRSGEGKTGFQDLAEDVRALAENIEEQSSSAMNQSLSLTLLIRENLTKIISLEQSLRENERMIEKKIMDDLDALEEQHHSSSRRRLRIKKEWEKMASSIGEIVSSLQFHDITRQRIEHVAEALSEFSEGQDEREAYEGFDLQREQLLHTKKELAYATERIRTELINLSLRIRDMSWEAAGIENGQGAGESFFSTLEKSIEKLSEAVNEHAAINKEIAKTTELVSSGVSRMEDFVKDIEKIGIEMKMIALNAAIHAAHVGEQGLALGVLAEQIHALSQGTAVQITAIGEDLAFVIAQAGRLNNRAALVSRRKADEGLQMVEKLRCGIPSLRELDTDAVSMLKQISTQGDMLSTEIGKRGEELHFHEQIIQGIESLVSEIERECKNLAKRFAGKRGNGRPGGGCGGMEELAKSYTMQRERDVHLSMLGLVDEGRCSSSPVRLPAPDENIRKGDEDGLGENVELF